MSALARYQSTGQRTITLNQLDETTNWHTFEAYLNHQRIGHAYLDLDNPEASYELDFDTRRLLLPKVKLGRLAARYQPRAPVGAPGRAALPAARAAGVGSRS